MVLLITMLKGTHIKLVGLEKRHLTFLCEIENNPQHWMLSDTWIPFSEKSLIEYIQSVRDLATDKQVRFVLEKNADATAVGFIDLFDYHPIHRRAGVGILVHPNHRREGHAEEALSLLVSYAFGHLNLHQLWANILEDNTPSTRLFEKMGFVFTGAKKQWMQVDGIWKNQGFYQLINKE
jgi:diamine N-acetyltransferase